jgi:hypothetical protein
VPGHAALGLIEELDDLLGDRRALGRDRVFEVVPEHEIGAVLLVEAKKPGRVRRRHRT